MIKKILFVSIYIIFSYANPYDEVSVDEKLTLLTNYFINETLKEKLPKKPERGKLKENDYNYEPTKYELNYNYVQRIKAIEESIKQEQKTIAEKYEADVYKYNKMMQIAHKKYKQYHNLYPIIQRSFNKALKVIYGKPLLKIQVGDMGSQFFLYTQAIYGDNDFKAKEIIFNAAEEKKMFSFYKKCEINVTFEYKDENIFYDEVICRYDPQEYRGKIIDASEKIKLKVKINDDIFQQLVLKDDNR